MRTFRTLGLGLLLAVAGGADVPPAPGTGTVATGISGTQLTLRLAQVRGRATVIGIDDGRLTVLTAAHFLAPEDVGKPILIEPEAGRLVGRVLSVARNPRFQPPPSRAGREPSAEGTIGVDTEVAVLAVARRNEAERRAFAGVRSADLASSPIPSTGGQIVSVHIVDQTGKEHLLRAGNHLNPKCLAWGRRSYDTRRGDSGAGVFILSRVPGGEPRPILIGNVSMTDDRGGIASLTCRAEPWIERAIDPPAPPAEPR